MLLQPVDKNHPILKEKVNPFVFGSSIDPVELARSLTELAITSDSISLSAPQCGIDARVFVIPDITEVYNYFVWRQQDCTRNSVSMAASANFSHFQLHGLSGNEKQELLFTEKGINWNDYKPKYKRGVVVKRQAIWVDGENGDVVQRNKWIPDYDTPEFSKDREYLQKLIPVSK
jgi:tRNA(His) 5'-end guanylyltransferase